jgi:transcriptional regulator with GAF, ATPase, and Fis domain/CHASE2 domain-containing sensor protein
MKMDQSRKNIIILIIIFLIFSLCTTLPLPWNEPINDAIIDLQFKIRGDRAISEEIIFIFVGDEDINALGGWPISRDYYSYLIHILQSQQARVIGLDVLLSKPDISHPEFDRILSDFIESAGNICLPFTFSELVLPENKGYSDSLSLLKGKNITLPFKALLKKSAAKGFSNFELESIIRKAPLVVQFNDEILFSFGLELARLYLNDQNPAGINSQRLELTDPKGNKYLIPTDNLGRIRLNHFGDIENIQAISLIDLLHNYKGKTDLVNLKDKLVIAAVTASGIANLKTTPLSSALPASLIHATIAENCIQQNFLIEIPLIWHWLILLVSVIFALSLLNLRRIYLQIGVATGIVVFYFFISMAFFTFAHRIIPVFYPFLSFVITIMTFRIQQKKQHAIMDTSIKLLFREQIKSKEKELEETKIKLADLESELTKEARLSDQTYQLSIERKDTILQLEKELNDLKTYSIPKVHPVHIEFTEIIHSDVSPMKSVLELVTKIRSDDIPVLIMGETGTGKEMIAQAIHQTSHRKNAPFVAINCGALSETLLESELFGHEKGSFTGAQARRKGRFELANGGTIFLDEITETSPAFQARLLRVLQEKTFERLGGEDTIHTDIHIIAATNKKIIEEIESGRFRSDLFYRLNVFPITLPSLKERIEDIPLLVMHFLKKYKFESLTGFSDRAMEILKSYHWPGNVRELENGVRRAAILAQSEQRKLIQETDLPEEVSNIDPILTMQAVHISLEQQILEMLQRLKFSHTAISQTAKALGNKDRGTITEYFRGICFEHLVKENFNVKATARKIAGTSEETVIKKVEIKINEYLNNLKSQLSDEDSIKKKKDILPAAYKGLPKKYHTYLNQVLEHRQNSI